MVQPTEEVRSFSFRDEWRLLTIVILVGILVRLFHDLSLTTSLFFGSYQLDSQVIHSWALDIARGAPPDAPFFRAPLYAYIIGGLYRLFGDSPWTFIIFHNLLGVSTSVLTYLLAREFFSRTVAVGSGLVVALFPTLLFYEGELIATVFEVFIYTLSVLSMHRAVRCPNMRRIAFASVTLGLAALTRPIILPLSLLFPLGLWLSDRRRSIFFCLSRSAIHWAILAITILPVTLVNLLNGNELVLISAQGGGISILAIRIALTA